MSSGGSSSIGTADDLPMITVDGRSISKGNIRFSYRAQTANISERLENNRKMRLGMREVLHQKDAGFRSCSSTIRNPCLLQLAGRWLRPPIGSQHLTWTLPYVLIHR